MFCRVFKAVYVIFLNKMFLEILRQSLSRNFYLPGHLIFYVTAKEHTSAATEKSVLTCLSPEKKQELSLAEIEKTARSLGKLLWLDIKGGEPFLREDLPKIVKIFHKHNNFLRLNIFTDGILTDKIEEATANLLEEEKSPVSIILSLDNLYEKQEEFKNIPGCFEKILSTQKKLTGLKKKYPSLAVKVHTVISHKNIKALENIIDFVKNKMPEIDFHYIVFAEDKLKDAEVRLPHINSLEARKNFMVKAWEEYIRRGNKFWLSKKLACALQVYLLDTTFKTLRRKKTVIPCYAGRIQAVLHSSGDVSLCALRKPIGNVADYQGVFPRLWYSQAAREEKARVNNKECFCYQQDVCLDNILFNPVFYLPLFKRLFFR